MYWKVITIHQFPLYEVVHYDSIISLKHEKE